jgi:sugar (pentulose or hexulose) kinase
MRATPVIAVIDVGKTNKKLFLFDQQYKIVYERSARFAGNGRRRRRYLRKPRKPALVRIRFPAHGVCKKEFDMKAINFSAYGASFVNIDEEGNPVFPLYNYLKAYPSRTPKKVLRNLWRRRKIFKANGIACIGQPEFRHAALPAQARKAGIISTGPKYALHLPQYLSYLISGQACSDITSIGCHTNLWDFEKNATTNGWQKKALTRCWRQSLPTGKHSRLLFPGTNYKVGIGLHDSSAALIPYMVNFQEPLY